MKTPPASPLSLSRRAEVWWERLLGFWRGPAGLTDPRLTEDERHRVGKVLQLLSKGLTRDRQAAGTAYLERSDQLGAYLLYFWPVSYTQFLWLRAFDQRQGAARPLGRVLDLGSGPGPLALACLEDGAREVWALDHSPAALKTAAGLAKTRGWTLQTVPWTVGQPLPSGSFDTITIGHLLNELSESQRLSLLGDLSARLNPGGRLLVLEPASTAINRSLLAWRDQAVRTGWQVVAPCQYTGDCPVLAADNGACHGAFAWKIPRALESLAWTARLGKEDLKLTWFILERGGTPPPPTGLRVIGDALLSKSGRKRLMLCTATGKQSLSVPADQRSQALSDFQKLRRGDLIEVQAPETRENGLGLTPDSRLSWLQKAPRA